MALFAVVAWLKERGEAQRSERGACVFLSTPRPLRCRSLSAEKSQAAGGGGRCRIPPAPPFRRPDAGEAVRQLNQDIADEYDRVFGATYGLVQREPVPAEVRVQETRGRYIAFWQESQMTQEKMREKPQSARSLSACRAPVADYCHSLPSSGLTSLACGLQGSPEISRLCCGFPAQLVPRSRSLAPLSDWADLSEAPREPPSLPQPLQKSPVPPGRPCSRIGTR